MDERSESPSVTWDLFEGIVSTCKSRWAGNIMVAIRQRVSRLAVSQVLDSRVSENHHHVHILLIHTYGFDGCGRV